LSITKERPFNQGKFPNPIHLHLGGSGNSSDPSEQFILTSSLENSSASIVPGTVLAIEDLKFQNDFSKLVNYESIVYEWKDGSNNLLSSNPSYPLNISDVGKDITLYVNASDFAANEMTEKVYSIGVVTNPDGLTDHAYDFREKILNFDLSKSNTFDYVIPSGAAPIVLFYREISRKTRLLRGGLNNVNHSVVNTTEGGFLESVRKLFFEKPIGKRDFFHISFVVKLSSTDSRLMNNWLELDDGSDMSAATSGITFDVSRGRISFGTYWLFRMDGVPSGEWGVITYAWLDNQPTSVSKLVGMATFKNTAAITPVDVNLTTVTVLDLEDRTGFNTQALGASSGEKTIIESGFCDFKQIVISDPNSEIITEAELSILHQNLFDALPD